ncbi:Cysteine synthase 2 [Coniochaeta pulveracea]|uniref:Cysteine synthase 2 n=1 Tax=Coniochaeta pulveracea TaxID=177199 RepID=A0A420XYD6_9PEZI|nr:Cysteine synthase 2 [Coniochaeta pulveracea]
MKAHIMDHPKAYGTAALTVAFAAGALVTLGFKDFYPDLEKRYQDTRKSTKHSHSKDSQGLSRHGSVSHPASGRRRSSYFFFEPVELEDHESEEDVGDYLPRIADGIEDCIGNTPLIKIKSLSEATGCTILAKVEFLNAAGQSTKDRVALNMIREAEEQGLLVPHRGDTIYEGTVGSTGISLATLARAMGYKAHICMPDDQSIEKSTLLHHLGATVERVPVAPITSPNHFVNLARTRAKEHTLTSKDGSRGFFADQFESKANFQAHVRTTGPEIWYQTEGKLDAFVAGAGTGGTISGVAKYLKEERKMTNLRVVLADPQGSGLYNRVKHGVMYSSTEKEGTRRRQQVDTMVEGIGINRITENFEAGRELVDDAVKVTDDQACRMARWLVENDGVFAGSSSAVNCVASVVTALNLPKGSTVVTILCDPGSRHVSKFYQHVADMGLEEEEHHDLLSTLCLEQYRRPT